MRSGFQASIMFEYKYVFGKLIGNKNHTKKPN